MVKFNFTEYLSKATNEKEVLHAYVKEFNINFSAEIIMIAELIMYYLSLSIIKICVKVKH